MLLSFDDIENKTFDSSRRGFDCDQVRSFLVDVAELVALMKQEIIGADEKLAAKEQRAVAAETRLSAEQARVEELVSSLEAAERRAAAAEVRVAELRDQLETQACVVDVADAGVGDDADCADGSPLAAADVRGEVVESAPVPDGYGRFAEKVATVLQAADEQAAEITREAYADAEQVCSEAEQYGAEIRKRADEHDAAVRRDADAYARFVVDDSLDRAARRLEALVAEADSLCRRMAEAEAEVMEPVRVVSQRIAAVIEGFDAACATSAESPGMTVERLLDEVRDAAPLTTTLARVTRLAGDPDGTGVDETGSDALLATGT